MKTSLYSLAQTEFKIHLFVFKCIMLSEINLTQKNTFWMLPFMCLSRTSKTNLWRKQVRNSVASEQWEGPGVDWEGTLGKFWGDLNLLSKWNSSDLCVLM